MRTLILGGTQFIGLHLLYELLRRGHAVTILNRGQTQADLPPEVERLYADRSDPAAVKTALAGREFDAAFDFSASTFPILAPAVEVLEGRVGRYVFCSTVGVYTPSQTFPIRESHPLAGEPLTAITLYDQYAHGKVACEEHLRQRNRISGLPFTILRPCLVYGPYNSQPSWEFSFFARLRRKRPVMIPGDGSRILHMVHVDDLARAFAAAPETGASLGQAYTLAGPEAVTLTGYVEMLGRIVGADPEILYVPPDLIDDAGVPSSFSGGWIWRQDVIFSTEKAESHLGYKPRPLSVGLAETYRWYRDEGMDAQAWDFSAEDRLLEQLKG